MTDLRHITDPEDPRVADYVDLNDPELRKGVEAAAGFFVAESPHVIVNVARAGRRFRSVLVTPKQQVVLAEVLTTLACPVYVAEEAVLRRVVGFNLHRGAVAAVERWPLPDLDAVLAGASRIAVIERVNDHENLGVLFRNAAALGVDAVILDRESADPLYRRCVRVSIGYACSVPWTRYDDLADIASRGFALIALTPATDAIRMDRYEWPARSAVIVGAEGHGLSEAALTVADARVRIPMESGVDSLNVATAAAIAFYEATRAR
jgi:tRNA G18 (ribose-2'-O)-methylase SpoU